MKSRHAMATVLALLITSLAPLAQARGSGSAGHGGGATPATPLRGTAATRAIPPSRSIHVNRGHQRPKTLATVRPAKAIPAVPATRAIPGVHGTPAVPAVPATPAVPPRHG